MLDLEISTTLLSFLLPFLLLFIIKWSSIFTVLFPSKSPQNSTTNKTPTSYPIVGSLFSIYANRNRNRFDWTSEILSSSPTSTFVLHRPLGRTQIFTANPSNVEHILKSHFHTYPKSAFFRMTQADLLGDGIFNTNGESWKFQRQVASHEFNTKSLRKFVEHVVDTELNDRLIPILSAAASNNTVLDLQDVLQRFAFDNVCAIAFGYDPASLVPSLPQVKFMTSFEDAVRISSQRFQHIHPLSWKAKLLLNFGSEKVN